MRGFYIFRSLERRFFTELFSFEPLKMTGYISCSKTVSCKRKIFGPTITSCCSKSQKSNDHQLRCAHLKWTHKMLDQRVEDTQNFVKKSRKKKLNEHEC